MLEMPFEEGIDMIVTAQREAVEEKLFLRWVVSYQTQMTFDEFKKKTNVNFENKQMINDDRSEEEIFAFVKDILGG